MLPAHSLVLYKLRPAIVQGTTDRIEIILDDGTEVRVRPKDIALLHPGPLERFSELGAPNGEVAEAWEVLAGANATTLRELAELAFGEYTPATAWAAWQAVADGIYFEGEPERLLPLPRVEVERRIGARRAEAEEKKARARFLEHARAGTVLPEDARYVRELEEVASSSAARSRLLRDLDLQDSPEGAHALLLELKVWDPGVNPWPARLRIDLSLPSLPFEAAPRAEGRRVLDGLEAFAIDDQGTTTPDDAVSFDGGSLWVHIADPASFIPPGSELDAEATRRGETLHLPEKIVHMLPARVIEELGLGIPELSPALSVRLGLDAEGNARALDIVRSLVRVRRLTYAEAELRLAEEPFKSIMAAVMAFRAAREARGAFTLEFPETRMGVGADGRVWIEPLDRTASRLMVQEAMVMTGQAVARWAAERGLAIPYSSQEGSGAVTELASGRAAAAGDAAGPVGAGASGGAGPKPLPLSQLWAVRRTLRRSVRTLVPGRHAGLGVEPYCQITSPLRRYLDLLAHHQILAALDGRAPLSIEETTRRMGEVDAVIPALRQAESRSERHWTLVYLLQNPGWTGEGVVVDQRARNLTVLVPSLALEAEVHTRRPVEPDGTVRLKVQEIKLPLLEAHFSVV